MKFEKRMFKGIWILEINYCRWIRAGACCAEEKNIKTEEENKDETGKEMESLYYASHTDYTKGHHFWPPPTTQAICESDFYHFNNPPILKLLPAKWHLISWKWRLYVSRQFICDLWDEKCQENHKTLFNICAIYFIYSQWNCLVIHIIRKILGVCVEGGGYPWSRKNKLGLSSANFRISCAY